MPCIVVCYNAGPYLLLGKDNSRAADRPQRGGQMGILYWVIVGLIAGWLTGKIMRGAGYGVIGDIVLGIVGGVVGGWIMQSLNIAGGGLIFSIVVAVLGAVILVVIVRALKRA